MILEALVGFQVLHDASGGSRWVALEAEISDIADEFTRLYCSTEETVPEIDSQLKLRTATLKSAREFAQGSGFVRKWRTMRNKDYNFYLIEIEH